MRLEWLENEKENAKFQFKKYVSQNKYFKNDFTFKKKKKIIFQLKKYVRNFFNLKLYF